MKSQIEVEGGGTVNSLNNFCSTTEVLTSFSGEGIMHFWVSLHQNKDAKFPEKSLRKLLTSVLKFMRGR